MSDIVISETTSEITTIVSQSQGPPGLNGISGGASLNILAAENLSGHIGVMVSSGLASAVTNNISYAGRLVGITKTSASQGSNVEIITYGELTGLTGLVTDSILYLQANGTISATYPATGYVQRVGVALSPTSALINIQPPIILG